MDEKSGSTRTTINQEDAQMVQVASIFSQLLQQFPRTLFQQLVFSEKAERHAKGFTCWAQFVAMLFCQLAQADSLRDICNGLRCCRGKLRHLGLQIAPKRSTLAYANAHRSASLYEQLFYKTYARFRAEGKLGRHRKFCFKNKLLSLDSTTVSLCLSIFPWASYRKAKGGVKIHVLLDHDHYMPEFIAIGEARRHDVTIAKTLTINPGSIVAMDRAYNDYDLFGKWTDRKIYFVTRMKEPTQYRVVQMNKPPETRQEILSDEQIILTGKDADKKCPHTLRRIVVWDEENHRPIVLLTNHLTFGSTTIAQIYRERWQIEIFFKTLKQTLKIKSFVGTSENALRIQIWTALIALLLFKWLFYLSTTTWSFSNLVAMLRLNLFIYRDLTDWLADPFALEPDTPGFQQLPLPFSGLGQLS
jgi:hypothetical protein